MFKALSPCAKVRISNGRLIKLRAGSCKCTGDTSFNFSAAPPEVFAIVTISIYNLTVRCFFPLAAFLAFGMTYRRQMRPIGKRSYFFARFYFFLAVLADFSHNNIK